MPRVLHDRLVGGGVRAAGVRPREAHGQPQRVCPGMRGQGGGHCQADQVDQNVGPSPGD